MTNYIHDSDIIAITHAISGSLPKVVRQAVEQVNEDNLVQAVRASNGTEAEKVVLYLQNTQQNCTKLVGSMLVRVQSEVVRRKLGIHPHQMKPVREALAAEGKIEVPEVMKGPFEILYRRPRSTTARS